jgi:hypothetical protein
MALAKVIPAKASPLDIWLEKCSGKNVISGAALAFLSAQISNLEQWCAALRARSTRCLAGKAEPTITRNNALFFRANQYTPVE